MLPKLTLETAHREENFHIITIDSGEVSLGRAGDNTVVIDSNSVSRHHGLIKPAGRYWIYTDCGSLNGSFCNDIPVGAGKFHILKNGDVVRLAYFTFRVSINEALLQERKPAVLGFLGDQFVDEFVVKDGFGIEVSDGRMVMASVSNSEKDVSSIVTNEIGNFWAYPQEGLGLVTVNATAIRKRVRLKHNDEVIWPDGKLVIIESRAITGDSGSLPRFGRIVSDSVESDLPVEDMDVVEEDSNPDNIRSDDTVVVNTQLVKESLSKVYVGEDFSVNRAAAGQISSDVQKERRTTLKMQSDAFGFLSQQNFAKPEPITDGKSFMQKLKTRIMSLFK